MLGENKPVESSKVIFLYLTSYMTSMKVTPQTVHGEIILFEIKGKVSLGKGLTSR